MSYSREHCHLRFTHDIVLFKKLNSCQQFLEPNYSGPTGFNYCESTSHTKTLTKTIHQNLFICLGVQWNTLHRSPEELYIYYL